MSSFADSCTRILGAIAPSWQKPDLELSRRVADVLRETPGARPMSVEDAAFAARVARLRRGLDEATADFLRGVGRASQDAELSAEEYAELRQELARSERAAVARSLATLLPPRK